MFDKRDEYAKMFRVEQQLWWYRILHGRVLTAIRNQFGSRTDVRILDAGCGTGGLLHYLREHGYLNTQGLDGSADAVAFCHERGLQVSQLNLLNLNTWQPDATTGAFDVVVCNDVFCYFDDAQLTQLVGELARRVRPGGLLITNNNAFDVFRGSHDLAVGSTRRFVRADLERLAAKTGLHPVYLTYWSLLLSPLILAVRQWQNLQLRLGWQTTDQPHSDVYLPPAWLNNLFYGLVRAEGQLLPRTPFGSSLFVVVKK
ncbi:MAG: class I SAM-dependent methyltransferase [Cytophagales bacterium]|nr:MAG: class I SAM-dependent methyltransferase [Cytophagales bacterium]